MIEVLVQTQCHTTITITTPITILNHADNELCDTWTE